MKGKSKYIIPLILAGVTATAGVAPSIVQYQNNVVVHAAENEEQQEQVDTKVIKDINGAEISMLGGFADTYKLGTDNISMPTVSLPKTETGFDIVYRIFRGSKEVKKITATSTVGQDEIVYSTTETYTPNYTGAYNVKITAEKDNTVVTELKSLTIMVEKTDASIVLPVNSKHVIPAQLKVGEKDEASKVVMTIPVPKVVVGDDEEGKYAGQVNGLTVKLVTPSTTAGTIDLVRKDNGTDKDYSDDYYEVTSAQVATTGTYQIRYEYREYENNEDTTGTLITKLETNFQVVKKLDAPEELYLKLNGSVPSKGNVNTEVKLPKVTVLDSQSSTDGINAHVTVKVTRLNADGTPAGADIEIKDYENYTFTPTQEGNYKVTYQADLFSLYSGVKSTRYSPATIIKIGDDANPTVMPTYNYKTEDGVDYVDLDGNGTFEALEEGKKLEDVLVNTKYAVPSVVAIKDGKVGTIVLPAIFGTDNKEIKTLEREIVGNNISKKTYNTNPNLAVTVPEGDIKEAGNYEIRYIATDVNGNKIRATYSMVVKAEADLKDGETTIKLNTGVSAITENETLRFSAPTVKDTYDSYLDVKTKYEVLEVTRDNNGKIKTSTRLASDDLTELNSDNKYELDMSKIITQSMKEGLATGEEIIVRITTSATADATLVGTRDSFDSADVTTTSVSKDIKVVISSNDEKVATMKINGTVADASSWNTQLLELNKKSVFNYAENEDKSVKTAVEYIGTDGYAYKTLDQGVFSNPYTVSDTNDTQLAAFDQGKTILKLPKVTFTDADENLRITLTIVDKAGNTVTKETYEQIDKDPVGNEYVYTVSNTSFKLSASGVYTVTYRAEDTAGNCIVKAFGIRVNDKTAPTIVIDDEDKYGVDIEVGEFFEVPYGTLIKDGKVEDGEVYWDVTWSDGADCEIASTGFTPLSEGTFYITYHGSDTLNNTQILQDNSLFFVNAKDTTAPVFNDDSSYVLPPVLAWDAEAKEVEVKIPVVYATDPIRNDSIDVVYSVTSPDGTKVTIQDYKQGDAGYSDAEDAKYFKAKAQGVYTITYTATDASNNKVTMTKEVAVGDCEAPEIEWTDNYKIETEKKLGDTFELKLKYLDITDNETDDDEFLFGEGLTISLLKPDGTTKVTNNGTEGVNYIWDLTETGAYTLRVVVEDEAGMSQTYKYTINVTSDDAENNVVSSVVGTVLVIVSVVILAGVVIYFVVSSRKKAAPRPSKSKKKD